jgi:hypothetical protein
MWETGRRRGSPILHHPPAERLEGPEVVVEGLRAELFLVLAESVQEGLDLGARDLRPKREAALLEDPRNPGACGLDVLGRVSLRFEGLAEVGDVLRERLGHRRALGVDQTDFQETTTNRFRQVREPSLEGWVRLPGGRDVVRHEPVQVLAQLLAGGLAGEGRKPSRDITLVPELDVPLRRGLGASGPVSILGLEQSHEGSFREIEGGLLGWVIDFHLSRGGHPSLTHSSIVQRSQRTARLKRMGRREFSCGVHAAHRGTAHAEKLGEFARVECALSSIGLGFGVGCSGGGLERHGWSPY